MALSNESYIVYTDTAGEIIVPIKEAVPYLNVELIGYQHYSYHSLMSQNLANIVDDIKALQDGGLAQATFDLDALIAEATANIDAQILGIESGINDQIILLTDQAVSETNTQLDGFNTTLYGDQVTTFGITGDVSDVVADIGDANSGLTKRVDTIETAVGDETSGGLVQKSIGISAIVEDIAIIIGDETSGMVEDVLTLENEMNNVSIGMVPRVSSLETIIGNSSSGLVQEINLNKDYIFGDGSYAGLFAIVGDNTAGAIKDINDNAIAIAAEVADTQPRLTSIETALGHLANTGLTLDVNTLQTDLQTVRTNLGDTDASGLRLQVANIEALNLQGVRDTLYLTDIGIVDITTLLRSDLDAVIASSTSDASDNNDAIALVDAKVNVNIADIDALEILTVSHTGSITTIDDNLNTAVTGVNAQLLNMPTTIQGTLLTFDDGTVTTFTPSILKDMKNETDAIVSSDIIGQFETYFGVFGSYLPAAEVGKTYNDAWIADIGVNGMKQLTEGFIGTYLAATYTMDDIAANKAALVTLNDGIGVVGSVAYDIEVARASLDDGLYGPTGSITILNSDDTVIGSVDHSIDAGITAYDATLQATTIVSLQDQIDALSVAGTSSSDELANVTEELQVEMVRYDTILPFLQTMFKYVNNSGEITDAEIDTVFGTVIDKVDALSATIVNQDYIIYFTDNGGTGLNTFDISIVLDKDLTFIKLIDTPEYADEFVVISRPADNYYSPSTFIDGLLDGSGTLVLESGNYLGSIEAQLYENESDTVGIEILDLLAPNDALVCRFATTDIFGQVKQHTIPIKLRP